MRAAASKGHTAMCKYWRSQQCAWDMRTSSAAARCGHVDLLRWFVNNGCPYRTSELCTSAAKGGSVEVLAYLQQQDMLTTTANLSRLLDVAACFNHLSAVKWIRAQGAQWPTRYSLGPWSGDVLAWASAEGSTTTS
jgi:hypothetical protein